MISLAEQHRALGATLVPDGIPLDYGDQAGEIDAATKAAILLDRSHEGRILLTGRDRRTLVNRMSTNDVASLKAHQGCATVFTNSNARILFRAVCLNRPEGLLLISEAGQGPALAAYLRRNIFFGDQTQVSEISGATAQFALHGPRARRVIESLSPDLDGVQLMQSVEQDAFGVRLTVARRKPICGDHWLLICAAEKAGWIHSQLLNAGADYGLRPAGSLTFNALRIRSGRPAGLELSTDYIPLEVGLWDEVSFSKGCYTGQEIIARMESRGRLAKTIVKLGMARMVAAPAKVTINGRAIGALTSSVQAADGETYGLAVVRLKFAKPGHSLQLGEELVSARVTDVAGAQPPFLSQLIQEQRSPD